MKPPCNFFFASYIRGLATQPDRVDQEVLTRQERAGIGGGSTARYHRRTNVNPDRLTIRPDRRNVFHARFPCSKNVVQHCFSKDTAGVMVNINVGCEMWDAETPGLRHGDTHGASPKKSDFPKCCYHGAPIFRECGRSLCTFDVTCGPVWCEMRGSSRGL